MLGGSFGLDLPQASLIRVTIAILHAYHLQRQDHGKPSLGTHRKDTHEILRNTIWPCSDTTFKGEVYFSNAVCRENYIKVL